MKRIGTQIWHVLKWLSVLMLFFVVSRTIQQMIGIDRLQYRIIQYPTLVPLIIISLKTATVIFAPLSGGAVYVLTWTFLPMREAIIYLSIGNFLWITCAYYLGRRYGDRVIRRCVGTQGLQQAHHLIDKLHDIWSFVITRVTLFPLEDLINYLAGMSKLPYRRFILISMLATSVVMLSVLWWTDQLWRLLTAFTFWTMPMMNFGDMPFIFRVLVVAGVIVSVYRVVHQHTYQWKTPKTPLDILKERYAKGEIDKQEFEEKKTTV